MKIFILLVLIEISLSFEDEPLRVNTRVLELQPRTRVLDDDTKTKHTITPNPTTPQTPPQDTGMHACNVQIYLFL